MSGEEHKPEPSKHTLWAALFSLVAPVAMVVGIVCLGFLMEPPFPVWLLNCYTSLTILVCLFGIVSACWAISRRPENSRLTSNSIQAIGFFGVLACLFVGVFALFIFLRLTFGPGHIAP